jgi:hypothetical protein
MIHISKLYLVINGFLYFPSFQASTVKDKGLGCPSSEPMLLALSVSENTVVHARQDMEQKSRKRNSRRRTSKGRRRSRRRD